MEALHKNVVYDIETFSPNGSESVDPLQMKLAVAVTFDENNKFKTWHEEQAEELIEFLLSFDHIIGFNIKHFDNAVISKYRSGAKEELDKKSIDMLEAIEYKLGHRLKLQSVVSATLGISKTADGKQAMQWWLEGKKEEVEKYCINDVKITKDLFLHGFEKKEVLYESLGEIRKIRVDWFNPKKRVDASDFIYQLIEDDGTTIELDEFQIRAFELIKNTNRLVYITGKAGTGKTTLLKFIKKNIDKNIAVVAPTGVAAINAGGQTLHSFFKILPQNLPYLPHENRLRFNRPPGDADETTIYSHFQYTAARREIMEKLELLIIDEVSMVRADLLDTIDKLLRAFSGRGRHKPFGGVQVVFIGDTFQLAPIEGNDWPMLSDYYTSPFFFSSKVISESPLIYIELEEIHRQNEKAFISLLNRIRVNQATPEDIATLNNKVQPLNNDHFDQNFIVLCSTNAQSNEINSNRLNSIDGLEMIYVGEIDGNFPNGVTEVNLRLKEGAQVMFLKNTADYYNGKVGKIVTLEEDKIIASTQNNQGEETTFEVEKMTWHNVRYSLNPETNRIEQEIIGTFTQYPIKLAWAITIHKSQGMTFEKVVVDINHFAPSGLTYVAFSRCTTLNGLLLRNPINQGQINVDQRVIEFAQNVTPDTLIVDAINEGKADQLYEAARHLIKKGDFETALNTFYQAIKYRNDLSTKEFKKYVLVQLKRISHNREQYFKTKARLNNLWERVEDIQLENLNLSEQINQLEKSNKNLEIKGNKEKAINAKLRKENEELKTKNKICKEEISRLKNLSWFDKLIGKT